MSVTCDAFPASITRGTNSLQYCSSIEMSALLVDEKVIAASGAESKIDTAFHVTATDAADPAINIGSTCMRGIEKQPTKIRTYEKSTLELIARMMPIFLVVA